jgi:hypothetical protein
MAKPKRRELAAEARRRNLEQLARLGAEVRTARHRRRLTQASVGELAGLVVRRQTRLMRYGGGP